MRKLMMKGFALFAIVFIVSCSSNQKEIAEIAELQTKVDSIISEKQVLTPEDRLITNELIEAYLMYAENYPEDSLSPAYVFEAAGLKAYIPDLQGAISIYNSVYEKFPESRQAPLSLMAVGGLYDVTLNEPEKARPVYELLLEKYPVQANEYGIPNTLKTLGMSPSESLEMILNANSDTIDVSEVLGGEE